MRRVFDLLALVGLLSLAAPPASAAVVASVENRTSGLPSGSNNLVGIEPRLSENAVRKNVRLGYEVTSGSPIAARTTTAGVGYRLTTVFDVLKNPSVLAGKSPAEVSAILGRTTGWRTESLGRGSHAGQGYVLREYNAAGNPTGRMIQWHPGGGHHGPNPYWRVRSPEGGISPIIPGGGP